jgi:hypothetical protein
VSSLWLLQLDDGSAMFTPFPGDDIHKGGAISLQKLARYSGL